MTTNTVSPCDVPPVGATSARWFGRDKALQHAMSGGAGYSIEIPIEGSM
jgi:hypothetical protein